MLLCYASAVLDRPESMLMHAFQAHPRCAQTPEGYARTREPAFARILSCARHVRSTAFKYRGRTEKGGGASDPVLGGVAPGEETVVFRPTSGQPSLLEGEFQIPGKSSRHISPISPTWQESIETEVIFPGARRHFLPKSRPADPRTPDMLCCSCLCYVYRSALCSTGTAEHRVPAPVGADTRYFICFSQYCSYS